MAYASGSKAEAFCDRCGFQYKLHDLRDEVVDMHETGLKVCSECWDRDQPQLQLGRWPVSDPQALRSPRPNGQSSGRLEGSLVFEFDSLDEVNNFSVSEGSLTFDNVHKCALWKNTSASDPDATLQRKTNDLTVSTSQYRYFRVRYRVEEYPSIIDWRLQASWLRYEKDTYDTAMKAANPENNYPMGDGLFESVWDMSDLNVSGDLNSSWTGSIRNIRFNIFNGGVSGSYKVEICGIYFDPAFPQANSIVEYGITNRNFEAPQFNYSLRKVGYSSSITTQHVNGSQDGGIDAVPGWTTSAAGTVGTVSAIAGVHVVKPGVFDPEPDFGQYLYLQSDVTGDQPVTVSQVTGNSIEPHTKYVLSADIGRRIGADSLEYLFKMKAGGVTLASASSPAITAGKFETVSVDYASTASGSEIGESIEIELDQSSTSANAQVGAHNFKVVGYPQFTYDFLDGTATATAGSGTYGIEGWAYWEAGKNPIDGSLVWDSSTKTVKLETPSLGASNPWDGPQFTYWDTKSPGVSADISTSKYSRVSVRIRKTSSGASSTKVWKGRFYFVQSSRVEAGLFPFISNEIVSEPSFVLNEWEELTWDLSQNSAWSEEGTATGFRFDFYQYDNGDTSTKDIFEIDYVRFN